MGLSFACTLKSMLGDRVVVRVHDRRWTRRGNRVVWCGPAEGNTRREQVVTLQSNVWSLLPELVRERLFVRGRFCEMWPLGPDSPAERGRPRNVKIRWVEDCLLELAQDVYGIELVPGAYSAPEGWDGVHVLAVADGARSVTRDGLRAHFGTPDRDLYSVDGVPLEERVLGIRVRAKVPDEYTVPLTVCQNRFLFNSLGGGFINMRLTAEEASEVVALGECGSVRSVDRLSFLWPRVVDGLRFFGVGAADVVGITSFTLDMRQMSRFTAQIAPRTFGFLLGDAANALHFWPGRGLNTGVKSALSLAVNLRARWCGSPFRASDFVAHEGVMHQLQYREKSRAWTTMLMPDENGTPRGIEDRIRDGLRGPFDREALVATLYARVRTIKARLVDRMGPLPADEWFLARITAMDVRTLKVMVESGPWITRETGGDEVMIQMPEERPSTPPVGLSLVS